MGFLFNDVQMTLNRISTFKHFFVLVISIEISFKNYTQKVRIAPLLTCK